MPGLPPPTPALHTQTCFGFLNSHNLQETSEELIKWQIRACIILEETARSLLSINNWGPAGDSNENWECWGIFLFVRNSPLERHACQSLCACCIFQQFKEYKGKDVGWGLGWRPLSIINAACEVLATSSGLCGKLVQPTKHLVPQHCNVSLPLGRSFFYGVFWLNSKSIWPSFLSFPASTVDSASNVPRKESSTLQVSSGL